VSGNSAWILFENNEVFYKGSSISFHFPNDESCGNWKQFKLWEKKEDEEKIIDIAVGNGFTLFLTENQKLWAIGELFLEKIDNSSQNPVEISSKFPQGMTCKRLWANNSANRQVAFVELVNAEGMAKIYSAGQSDLGLLG